MRYHSQLHRSGLIAAYSGHALSCGAQEQTITIRAARVLDGKGGIAAQRHRRSARRHDRQSGSAAPGRSPTTSATSRCCPA